MRLIRVLLAVALVVAVRPAAAQTIIGQDSTLTGLKRVFVKFEIAEGSLDAGASTELQNAIVLELRKAGIRVAKSIDEIDATQDGVVLVQFVKIPRSLSTDAVFRIDVRQAAQLARTGRAGFMVTWFYEDNGRNVIAADFAAAAARRGTDDFISRWLDMNGR